MPKRVIDFDAMWASDKLAACSAWAQAEYAWLYGLADCNGCFECTNLRVIWGRVAAIRRGLPIERLEKIFEEFARRGLLFVWQTNGKRYAHWTGSDVPGRLPPPSWRNRLERLAPPVPQRELEQYVAECADARFARDDAGGSRDAGDGAQLALGSCVAQGLGPADFVRRDANGAVSDGAQAEKPRGTPRQRAVGSPQATEGDRWEEVSRERGGGELKAEVESAPAEDLDLSLDLEREGERHTSPARAIEPNAESRVCEENPIPGLFENQNRAMESRSGASTDAKVTEKPRPYPDSIGAGTTGRATQPAARSDAGEHLGAEELAEIWEQERGALPALRAMTPERVARCRARLAHARDARAFLVEFCEAVRRAASTPFLCGAGPAGWRANFDWFIANGTNYCKVLEGRYDAAGAAQRGPASDTSGTATAADDAAAQSSSARNSFAWRDAREAAVQRELRAGSGPQLEPGAARVRPEVLERWKNRHAG